MVFEKLLNALRFGFRRFIDLHAMIFVEGQRRVNLTQCQVGIDDRGDLFRGQSGHVSSGYDIAHANPCTG